MVDRVKHISVTTGEAISLGLGLVVGTLLGAIIPDGSWPQGTWIVVAAFVAGSFALYQIRLNKENAAATRQREWKEKRLRVTDILLGELQTIAGEYYAVIEHMPEYKQKSEKLRDDHDAFLQRWANREFGNAEMPKSHHPHSYMPSEDLVYFREFPEAVEYLPVEIVAELGHVKRFLTSVLQDRAKIADIRVIVDTMDSSTSRLESLLKRILKFHDQVQNFRDNDASQL